ncbi:MAG: GGDEF domain-containing protein, partial [Desulfocapsa sp.]|nr:GGDEF domain-containing protein [Desulfocapsa sp.]
MCDIDHFKLYNDTYGHQAGDKSIQMVAKALAKTVNRPADMVARYGGEEFVVVLPETDQTGALAIADLMQKMIENLQIPHSSSKTADFLTISLGVATMTTQRSTEKELIEAADKALYASKNNGRNMFTHANDI